MSVKRTVSQIKEVKEWVLATVFKSLCTFTMDSRKDIGKTLCEDTFVFITPTKWRHLHTYIVSLFEEYCTELTQFRISKHPDMVALELNVTDGHNSGDNDWSIVLNAIYHPRS